MKNNLQLKTLCFAFYIVSACAAICSAQPARIVGGFRQISKTDQTAVEAAKFAAETQGKKDASLKLISVASAERQIVAGSNYRLCLAFDSNKKRQEATAVVYLNLQNEFSLTSWAAGKCSTATNQTNDSDSDNESVKSSPRKTDPGKPAPPTVSNTAAAPDVIVKNLYSAQKTGANPFFQAKNRALVDKYFTKPLADLLWKDVFGADGVGNLDFDPLYNAQDTKITVFKIGKPEYGEGNMQVADVPVTFKNMGKAETILFRLEQNSFKMWKISDIYYPSNEETNSSLKAVLSR